MGSREESPQRRRVVVVPVSAASRPTSPQARSRITSTQPGGVSSYHAPVPVTCQAASEDVSADERERFLREISSLRRENVTLLDEVAGTREQAMRHLRTNAERALQS